MIFAAAGTFGFPRSLAGKHFGIIFSRPIFHAARLKEARQHYCRILIAAISISFSTGEPLRR